jgi:hypothetical protein
MEVPNLLHFKPAVLSFCDSLNGNNFNAQMKINCNTRFIPKLIHRYRYIDIFVNFNWVDTRWQ